MTNWTNFLNTQQTSQIPDFMPNGKLPPGIHNTSWEEFKNRYELNYKRKMQLKGLEKAIEEFYKAGCTCIYVDGSFVTKRSNPGDFDALYDLDEVNIESINPLLLDSSLNGRDVQKKYYEGEFFPMNAKAHPNGTKFLDYFQKDKRTDEPKGIVKINLR
ncbi:hypothetical protein [Bacillus sp. AFS017336]|uniref:DUF6932 family protein n=1 Tax=Bacillus sp. AFS017336 TaxID=2033489 RepID=UPI000BF0EBAA|nr:hypothetical protein [Bacillus sp. AFS017336]PEK99506.1 hypothetical protein CN601_23850 [Bacillus sp. AFS017336]